MMEYSREKRKFDDKIKSAATIEENFKKATTFFQKGIDKAWGDVV